ncbi:MAG: hypothetical protein ACO3JG_02135 [Luteolibacter sp.]
MKHKKPPALATAALWLCGCGKNGDNAGIPDAMPYTFENCCTPALIDTEPFEVTASSAVLGVGLDEIRSAFAASHPVAETPEQADDVTS